MKLAQSVSYQDLFLIVHILTPLPRCNQVVVQVKSTHLDLLLSNHINCAHQQLVVVPPQELQKHHTLFWGLFVTDGW